MALLHVLKLGDAQLTSVYVLSEVKTAVVMLARPEPFSVAVWFAPPFTVYVTIAPGVPLKLTVAVFPLQTDGVPEMVALGKGTIESATGVRGLAMQFVARLYVSA